MKISLFKKLLAVSLALATVMFAGCQKDEPAQGDENPSENISQNVDETTSDNKTDEVKSPIDLSTVDLSQYGISSDNEISEPLETSKGNYYYVRDFITNADEEFDTYRFFTTDEDIMCAKIATSVPDFYIYPIGYVFYDINNDGVEELIVHEKVHVNNFEIFTFEDDKMIYAGCIFNDFGQLYCANGTLTAVGREFSGGDIEKPYCHHTTFEFNDNKITETGSGNYTPLNDAETSQFGQLITFNVWPER